MRDFFSAVTRSPVSLLGSAITTASALVLFALLAMEVAGLHGNPYVGILTFMILPGIFVFGLLLIPLGYWMQRRREKRGESRQGLPVIDLNRPKTLRLMVAFLALSLVNIVILATVTYKGVEFMDSTEFCGQVCHSVMEPEFAAYERSPHARVDCVDCHIGPGADFFVKAKVSGTWQVVSVNLDLYPRPIPTPVHNLRPARETCEQCHWPAKFVGDRLQVKTSYAEDEENTELKTVLLLRVGGIQGRDWEGIHWHVNPENRVRYRSDESRETIHEVELTEPDGTVKLFRRPGADEPEAEEGGEGEALWREMDCVDCHNRPTHIYRLPEREINTAMQEGRLPRDLPFLRREAVAAMRQEWTSHEEARTGIDAALRGFYQESYPELAAARAEEIAAAAKEIGDLFCVNVYPPMNITWGTYPDHIGHEDSPGCFRCHDDELATDDGQAIAQDCSLCHSLLAWEEEDPEVLATLNP